MYRRIAVGFDGSQGSRRALEVAVNLARSAKAELFLVSIEELPRYPAAIDEVDDEQRSAERFFKEIQDEAVQQITGTGLLAGRLAEGDLIGDPIIYAAVAKSMLVRGEWGTQYLAGQPFFDKPPLVVWLAALSFKLFGVSTWSARLPGVALGIAASLVLWRLGAFLFDERVGLAAGAILALTPGFVRFGSTLLLDTALALGALAGLLATARAFARGGSGLWWAGVWFGVAFLGKGALALGAPAVLATYWLATPGDRRPPLGALVVAALPFLAVVPPRP